MTIAKSALVWRALIGVALAGMLCVSAPVASAQTAAGGTWVNFDSSFAITYAPGWRTLQSSDPLPPGVNRQMAFGADAGPGISAGCIVNEMDSPAPGGVTQTSITNSLSANRAAMMDAYQQNMARGFTTESSTFEVRDGVFIMRVVSTNPDPTIVLQLRYFTNFMLLRGADLTLVTVDCSSNQTGAQARTLLETFSNGLSFGANAASAARRTASPAPPIAAPPAPVQAGSVDWTSPDGRVGLRYRGLGWTVRAEDPKPDRPLQVVPGSGGYRAGVCSVLFEPLSSEFGRGQAGANQTLRDAAALSYANGVRNQFTFTPVRFRDQGGVTVARASGTPLEQGFPLVAVEFASVMLAQPNGQVDRFQVMCMISRAAGPEIVSQARQIADSVTILRSP
jgi:hypothetical protein